MASHIPTAGALCSVQLIWIVQLKDERLDFALSDVDIGADICVLFGGIRLFVMSRHGEKLRLSGFVYRAGIVDTSRKIRSANVAVRS